MNGTAKGVGVLVPVPPVPNNERGEEPGPEFKLIPDPGPIPFVGVGDENTLFPHPDLVISIGVVLSELLNGALGVANPLLKFVAPYFFSSFRIKSCSCPLYFSSNFGIS